ncbi:SufE-like protein 1, chloroplastic/mitochondrial [Orobanche minor]
MASRTLISRANRIKTKLETALQAAVLEVDDVSYQHAGHAAVREMEGGASETHFNLKIVSSKFEGKNLVNRHRMIYELLSDELESGLHALSITAAKTPKEAGPDTCTDIE